MEKKTPWDLEVYSAVWSPPHDNFANEASKILGIPVKDFTLNRHIGMGSEWGTLSIYLFKPFWLEEKPFYHADALLAKFSYLSPKLEEFKTELKRLYEIYQQDSSKVYYSKWSHPEEK